MTLFKKPPAPAKSLGLFVMASLLSACGGGNLDPEPTRLDVLLSNDRGMQSIVVDEANAYVSLFNSPTQPSAVMRTGRDVQASSTWQAVTMGGCGLAVDRSNNLLNAGTLQRANGKTYLVQGPIQTAAEHTLCVLDTAGTSFATKDEGLKVCTGGYCDVLWASQLKAVGTRLFTNAGAGPNLLVSDNQGASWRAVLGAMDSMICTHQSFHVVGSRVLVGGECPLDMAYLRAYALSADGGQIPSQTPLPVALPVLENRNLQFIDSIAGTQRVFAGVEGGLLRSDDNGLSFKFVIKHEIDNGKTYPYITSLLSPTGKPSLIVAAGFDKATAKPYLAWSANGGDQWTDVSKLVPGFERPAASEATTQITSLAEDAQGRILLTVNEDLGRKGKLMRLTLGTP